MTKILSKRYIILYTLNMKLPSFEYVKDLYANDNDFVNLYNVCEKSTYGKFYRLDGYLLKENKLCVRDSSMRNCSYVKLKGIV